MSNCLFCKIAGGQIPSSLVHSDDRAVAFKDIQPQAPTHVLVIPRLHIAGLADVGPDQWDLVAHCLRVAADVARSAGLVEGGYRLVTNNGSGAGQSVFHLHFHVLGGRPMSWPPG